MPISYKKILQRSPYDKKDARFFRSPFRTLYAIKSMTYIYSAGSACISIAHRKFAMPYFPNKAGISVRLHMGTKLRDLQKQNPPGLRRTSTGTMADNAVSISEASSNAATHKRSRDIEDDDPASRDGEID